MTISTVATAVLLLICSVSATAAPTAATPSAQPKTGPGGSATPFRQLRVIDGGQGVDAWEILIPADPAPPAAPLVVVMHGYYEFSGYSINGAIARHTALKGNVVIYPRWQTAIATPCPGPLNIQPCITSATTAIHSALAYLHAHPRLVQPRLYQASYFGFSFGGVITADMTSRYQALKLPKPRAIFLDDPHDGGLTGTNEPAVYPSLAGIPASAKVVCHAGASGIISLAGFSNASCNSVFPKLALPAQNKSIVLTSNDSHGQPALAAIHGVCAGPGAPATTPATGHYPVDAYDWGFCWRSFDALRTCALYDVDCQYALGNTADNRYIGTWSDGVPIIGLKIQQQAPIYALPIPKRQPAPKRGTADIPPRLTIRPIGRATPTRRIALHGTAYADNGVAFVEIAVTQHKHAACTQLNATRKFSPLSACSHPTSVLFANGATQWKLTLPRLHPGTYRVLARAVDSFGQTPHAYTEANITVN